MPDLTHAYVNQVVHDVAAETGVAVLAILGDAYSRLAVAARRRALKRIATETGANARKIARIWGADASTVHHAIHAPEEPAPRGPYDEATKARLVWAHGAERAERIADGRDTAALGDLAAWRALASPHPAAEAAEHASEGCPDHDAPPQRREGGDRESSLGQPRGHGDPNRRAGRGL